MSAGRSHHAEWLELVEISGPFLSPPVLERAFPLGLDALDSDHAAKLRLAREEWAEEQDKPNPDPEIHDQWIRFVLTETLEYSPEVLQEGDSIPEDVTVEVEEHRSTLHPDFVVADPDTKAARLLVHVHPPAQDLGAPIPDDSWAAPPAARMTQHLRASGVRIGLVTNGERWMLVDAPEGEAPGYVSWYSWLWSAEPLTLRAFRSLLGVQRFFGVDESETLEALLAESANFQAEVTEQLGAQVRSAVETLVQSLDRADADTGRKLLRDLAEADLYEAAITVMMRLVFLFFAEENDLLPLSDDLYQQHYAASTIREQLAEERDRVGVEVLEKRQDAWNRLLATFRVIYGGADHDQLHLPAYGGSLFDPDRFSFIEGRTPGTTWRESEADPLPIDNRTVLHLLDALQLLRGKGGKEHARKLSFRALDIEQIGHVYEMLLDHTILRADAPTLGLQGAKDTEPEVPIAEIEEHAERGEGSLVEFLAERTKKSGNSIRNALMKEPQPEWGEKLRLACGNDEELLARVRPYQALIRTDPWGDPIVFREGALYVTSGTERRATGTYYTPRALTEEIVTHALEPLVYRGPAEGKTRDEWELKSVAELLDLKICDPAMGSGAFLVQVVRYLAERLVEAWEQMEEGKSGAITAEGGPSIGSASELLVPRDAYERIALAKRLVSDRCVYGVDVNPLAVEMAKLSLWLVTLAKGKAFSFLDHALKRGDSLLGVHNLRQIRYFHPDPERGGKLHSTLFDPVSHIEKSIRRALELRQRLESFTVLDIRNAEQKAKLNSMAEEATSQLRLLGDLVIGAALSTAEKGERALDESLRKLADTIPDALELPAPDETLQAEAMVLLNEGRPFLKPDRRPFHWPVEFPEVFERPQRAFDALLGNPPFLGGKRISGPLGTDYRTYLVSCVGNGKRGNADLVAYFFLRGRTLVGDASTMAFLATNTIAQGDTREVGLDQILTEETAVVRAHKSRAWPGDATIQIAQVWIHRGSWLGPRILDGKAVTSINSSLDSSSRASGLPYRLAENRGKSFIGWLVNGIGFLLSPAEARALIERDARNRDVLLPYLNGHDLNSSPTQEPSRWVIYFQDWSLEKAEEYPDCLGIIRTRAKPQRDQLPDSKKRVRDAWWRFEYRAPALHDAIAGKTRMVVLTRVSRTVVPLFVPTEVICSDATVVFPYDDPGHLGVLSSLHHWWWAVTRASTMRTDLRYTPTDCFETFPIPAITNAISHVAERLDDHRRTMMLSRDEGLTTTYGHVHDPRESAEDVVRLRELQVELDHAVSLSYGWERVELDHDFYETSQGMRYTLGPDVRAEILDRLLELNHERHTAELTRQGELRV